MQKLSHSIPFLHSVAPTCEGLEWIPGPSKELVYTLFPPAQQSVITAVPLPLRWPSLSHHPPLWSPHSLVSSLSGPSSRKTSGSEEYLALFQLQRPLQSLAVE